MNTGRAALYFGPGKPFEIVDLPVPEPQPGALVMRITRANVCGSDLHIWRGDGNFATQGKVDGRIIGHEMTGVVHSLGDGVEHDCGAMNSDPAIGSSASISARAVAVVNAALPT